METQVKSKVIKDVSTTRPQPITDKAVRVLASSIFKTLKDEGCEAKDIIGVSSQLIGLVTTSLNDKDPQ